MPRSVAPGRRALLARGAAVTVLSLTLGVSPALAWKPKTHIYLAEEAMRDALADGKVTLYETDYASGKIVGTLGEYEVDPKILAALQAAPKQFRAGVIGPDAYPDIVTGQTLIHPEEAAAIDAGADGSNAWLTHVWREGFTRASSPQVNAFAVGYLTHAAGDVFAHTFVNHFAGGEFMLFPNPENAIKHLTLEGYVGKRTPMTLSAVATSTVVSGSPCSGRKRDDLGLESAGCGQTRTPVFAPVTQADTSIDGVEAFILNQMTLVTPGSLLETKLYQGSGTAKSIPFLFSTLRAGLAREVADYDRTRMSKLGPDRLAYSTINGPAAEYKRAWCQDIDEGLAAWPVVSHELAKALVYNESGADLEAAKAALDRYVRDHLLSMAGVPDVVVMTAGAISDVIGAILPPPLKEALGALMRAPLDFLVEAATGKSPREWADYLKTPEVYFNEVMTRPGGGHDGDQPHAVTLAAFNRDYLKIADAAYGQPGLKWKIHDLPAAFDTVQLTKMMLLSPAGLAQLRATLKAKGADTPAPGQNALLGWVTSLDHGNQWQGLASAKAGAAPQPFFAANGGAAYRKLFLKVPGEKDWMSAAPTDAPAPATPSPPTPPPSQPVPAKPRVPRAADAVSVAELIGSWTSAAAGVLQVERTATGALATLTAPNFDRPTWEVVVTDADETALGEWRMFGGGRINGALRFGKGAKGQVIITETQGDPLAGRPRIVLTKAADHAATRTDDATSIAGLLGPRTSAAGEVVITRAPGGARAQITSTGLDHPTWEIDIVDGPQYAKGGWRMVGGPRVNGQMLFRRWPDGRVVLVVTDGDPVAGRPDLVLSRAAPAKAAAADADWLPALTSGAGAAGFQPLGPLWEVRFDGAEAQGRDLHVAMRVRNVSGYAQNTSPGSFIPKLTLADGRALIRRGFYDAASNPPVDISPVIPAKAELSVRFVFERLDATPRTFSLQADNSRASESLVLTWDVSNAPAETPSR